MTRLALAFAAGIAATALLIGLVPRVPHFFGVAEDALSWQAINPEIPIGDRVRLEAQIVEPDGNRVTKDVKVTNARLDMGPDGMETMTARLHAASAAPGTVAFDADVVMAGRWALTITATIDNQTTPVTGKVVFTAVEKESDDVSPPINRPGRKIVYYRNPMGLSDISPVPKKDSMGMDYIPVYEDEVSGPPGTVRVSLDKVQRAGVRTALVGRRVLNRTVRAAGTVVADESRLAAVTAKFGGFIEEMFVSTTGAEVRAGQPLVRVWIEGPEILQKQADLLSALRSSGRANDVERTARNLRLFGIPDPVIEQLKRTGEPVRSITLAAPAKGTVMEKPAVVGMRFAAGDTLFRTADLATVWVMAQVAERDLALVRPGQAAQVTMKAFPETPLGGRVTFVYPELDMATRSAALRIVVPNPNGQLKTGLYADVAIEARASTGSVVAIPASAVIDSGDRRVAFVAKDDGLFEPRDLVLGPYGDGFVEVREGLAEGERIVVSGNFLIDAESNLRAALAAFTASESSAK